MMLPLPDANQFVHLTDGLCHYRLDGPDDGPVLLMLHGATVPAWEFDLVRPLLNEAGYRTLCPDLFGHGYSDRPRTRYTCLLFVQQMIELLEKLNIAGPFAVVGHSLGAAIGTRLALTLPRRVKGLVLAAPLLDFTVNLASLRLLNVPVVGEMLTTHYVVPMLVRRRTRRYRLIEDGRFVQKFKDQLTKPGFDRALLALVRDGALSDQQTSYRQLAESDQKIMLLWGDRDTVLPRHQRSTLSELLPRATRVEFADAQHSILMTHAGQAAGEIDDFLRRGI